MMNCLTTELMAAIPPASLPHENVSSLQQGATASVACAAIEMVLTEMHAVPRAGLLKG